jgi:hypothetical protein
MSIISVAIDIFLLLAVNRGTEEERDSIQKIVWPLDQEWVTTDALLVPSDILRISTGKELPTIGKVQQDVIAITEVIVDIWGTR